ncbi:DUF1926 domain-containing protein [Treponema brennaborense]|uniref:Glycoside hydrolase family 57 n=1 Tax=Treponema brennaborense (strain DSM 12168 / CIP 105900 / DD5/3) TaxID=906968 RepID=F4LMQ4_TREBD|nr:DUF1926 domain-containing protein [Treponema brennaborense]AEE16801.1 glycoside hydrolase family 57 [Treponema brennaborense DSM 12168]
MGTINLCFEIGNEYVSSSASGQILTSDANNFEHLYQSVYKKLVSFLYARPSYYFSFSFCGLQLEWFSKKHPEFLLILSELLGRKQIELFGGGYYEPLLPALLPVDRVGQIELMTTAHRRLVGKRPRGIRLPHDAWDASLISSLKTCGIEYVVLESSLIPSGKTPFLPYIVQDQGKSICVLGEYQHLLPSGTDADGSVQDPDSYLDSLISAVRQSGNTAEHAAVCCRFTPAQIGALLDSGWLERLFAETASLGYNDSVELSLPSRYMKLTQYFQRAYIPAAVCAADTAADGTAAGLSNIYDYMLRDPNAYLLYSKMMYVSMLVNQCRGDKIRKKAAREKLWEAQFGGAYVPSPGRDKAAIRQYAYHCLIQAEKTVRECSGFCDSVTSFDYDCDGIREYVCQFEQFSAYIQARGGSVYELDVYSSAVNYAGNSTGHTGLFLDYIFDVQKNKTETLTRQIYTETLFDSQKHEVRLSASGTFGDLNQPLTLRKNYVLTGNGIQVQYIIKNASPFPFKQQFAVESNFVLSPAGKETLQAEIVADDRKAVFTLPDRIPDEQQAVSLVRLSDSDVSFVFEPNENAAFSLSCGDGKLSAVLSWPIELAPGFEMEKVINFSVVPQLAKKRRRQ